MQMQIQIQNQKKLINQQLKYTLLMEILVNNQAHTAQPIQLLEIVLNYQNDQDFLDQYQSYIYNHEIEFQTSTIIYDPEIDKQLLKFEFSRQSLVQILSLIHSYLNYKYLFLEQMEEVYIILDPLCAGFINEDQGLFLFLALLLSEKLSIKIDILQAYIQFWASIQSMGKVSLRVFKQFLFIQNYDPFEIATALNRIQRILEIDEIPNIRVSILNQLFSTSQYSEEQQFLIQQDLIINSNELLQLNPSNLESFQEQFLILYKESINKYIQLFYKNYLNIQPFEQKVSVAPVLVNKVSQDFVQKNISNMKQGLATMSSQIEKDQIKEAKVITLDLSMYQRRYKLRTK